MVLLVMIVGFLGLWMAVDNKSSDLVGDLIEGQMKDAVQSRAYIIDNYVRSAEEYLVAFAKSDEVRDLLKDPQSKELTKRAQEYTVEFAKVEMTVSDVLIVLLEKSALMLLIKNLRLVKKIWNWHKNFFVQVILIQNL